MKFSPNAFRHIFSAMMLVIGTLVAVAVILANRVLEKLDPADASFTSMQQLFGLQLVALVMLVAVTLGMGLLVLQPLFRHIQNKERALRVAIKKAEAATEAKAQFLATMSHEIRTPLNGVLGMNGLLLRTPLNETQQHYAETVQEAGNTLLQVINDVLDFSRLEAGHMALDVRRFQLQGVLGHLTTLLQPVAADKNLSLSLSIDEGVPDIMLGDPDRLRQILFNLVGNGLKFTAQGSVAVLVKALPQAPAMQKNQQWLRFSITDTGPGIAEEDHERIFDMFAQADSTTSRRHEGSGLGLAICRKLVTLMGGRIGVESIPGSGSTFWFELPFATLPDTPALQTPQSREDAAETYMPELEPQMVLLVEDNPINAELATILLEQLGHSVHTAKNGSEALDALANRTFDAIFMDIHMPQMDGYEATAAIRALPDARAYTPIIAMTANALEGDREKCLKAGMDNYIAKPITRSALQTVLAASLKKPVGGL